MYLRKVTKITSHMDKLPEVLEEDILIYSAGIEHREKYKIVVNQLPLVAIRYMMKRVKNIYNQESIPNITSSSWCNAINIVFPRNDSNYIINSLRYCNCCPRHKRNFPETITDSDSDKPQFKRHSISRIRCSEEGCNSCYCECRHFSRWLNRI